MADIFNFKDVDLVNLQGWYKKAPKHFTTAARTVLNTVAGSTRNHGIVNIKSGTTTRQSRFVDNSIRVDKAKGTILKSLVSETYSVSLSSRSDGFESLEDGSKVKGHRVPTLASRGGGKGREGAKVARNVRMDKQSSMLKWRKFGTHKKRAVIAMLRTLRENNDKTPFEIPSGLNGKLGRMVPGIWKVKGKGNTLLMNPYKGKRGKTKPIHWMRRATTDTTSTAALTKLWGKQVAIAFNKK